jgi:hypothetical protein
MSLEVPRDIMVGVDEPTFDQEKSLRLKPEEIEKLGEYILRLRLVPDQDYFAVDFPVKVLSVIDSEIHKRVKLEMLQKRKISRPAFDELFDPEGFIRGESVDPTDDYNQIGEMVTLGYLLGGRSIDLYGHDLYAYLKNPQRTQEIKTREKQLVAV